MGLWSCFNFKNNLIWDIYNDAGVLTRGNFNARRRQRENKNGQPCQLFSYVF